MDDFETDISRSNVQEFTVSELSLLLKRKVEDAFPYVKIRGEVSKVTRAGSGHLYFDLKDESSLINAIAWRGVAGRFKMQPEQGMEVVVTGKISTYPGRSTYQIIIDQLEPAGAGALMALLEERRKKLAAEGLFDASRKQEIPFLPKVIGVVTSPTGAVIRDILHRLSDRFPVRVLVWPVLVQGEGAKEQITSAIQGFNAIDGTGDIPRPDVLIVARGGGSLEDLWAFNEEEVVRAAAASEIPLISAVGHETDTTLIDFASDKRAPTPTAAAEMAVPVRAELVEWLLDIEKRLFASLRRDLQNKAQYLNALARGLTSPKKLLENMMQRLDDWAERLKGSLPALVKEKQHQLNLSASALKPQLVEKEITQRQERVAGLTWLLESYHYKNVLKRGYALVWDEKKTLVTNTGALKAGMNISIELNDGAAKAVVEGGSSKSGRSQKKPKTSAAPAQESLF